MTVHKDACELPRFPSIIPPKRLDDYIYRAWSIYRFQYTKCNLTYSTDKLVAIQGIATWVSQVTGDEFVAGLWRSRIIEELCWYRDIPGAESSPWRAPSWSWASCDEGIRMCVTAHLHMQCATRQIEAELVDLNVNAKTSGQLEAASMRIKCKLLYALLIPQSSAEWPGDPRHDSLELFSSEGDPTNSNLSSRLANLDVFSYIDIDDGRIPEPEYGYVSVIQYCAHASTSEIPEVTEDSDEQEDDGKYPGGRFEALFLKPCDEASQAFKRVGIISPMTARTLRLVLKAHHMAEERVIILV
ncbi:HET-like protein [Stemphylium lycopersici]|uniref:HET-like protein n=1 Tax=Stemphylium lycopersici TaxID=183478 RepID=A0A364MVD5_STELY|nr:hypothetical protein TW65_08452 [Stemphylium lycopersici]RAR01134.1 HET-like protein [Stemphylium lycopersici]RAR04773.1 HET-like protein [Stemphylium lycopersici]